MRTNNRKNHQFHIMIFFIMLLFAVCLTVNAVVCCNYYLYELSDQAAVIETQTVSERMGTSLAAKGDDDDIVCFQPSFLSKYDSYIEIITRNKCSIPMSVVLPKEFGQLILLIIAFLYFYVFLFILLSDGWTLINQKVRLDN